MLKINDDLTVELDENVTPEQISELIISFYLGTFSTVVAKQISEKSNGWKKELEKTFLELISNRFEEELKQLMIKMNKPFFNNLGIVYEEKRIPFIHPLMVKFNNV